MCIQNLTETFYAFSDHRGLVNNFLHCEFIFGICIFSSVVSECRDFSAAESCKKMIPLSNACPVSYKTKRKPLGTLCFLLCHLLNHPLFSLPLTHTKEREHNLHSYCFKAIFIFSPSIARYSTKQGNIQIFQ